MSLRFFARFHDMMRELLKRVPALRMVYDDFQMLRLIVVERWWTDRVAMNDHSLLTHEWDFEAPLERERYVRTLQAIARYCGPDDWGDVAEIGCAEGLFTAQLAPHCRRLSAYDISPVAVARTADRCASFTHVKVERLDLYHNRLPGLYDLVLAMDVLEFIHGQIGRAHV